MQTRCLAGLCTKGVVRDRDCRLEDRDLSLTAGPEPARGWGVQQLLVNLRPVSLSVRPCSAGALRIPSRCCHVLRVPCPCSCPSLLCPPTRCRVLSWAGGAAALAAPLLASRALETLAQTLLPGTRRRARAAGVALATLGCPATSPHGRHVRGNRPIRAPAGKQVSLGQSPPPACSSPAARERRGANYRNCGRKAPSVARCAGGWRGAGSRPGAEREGREGREGRSLSSSSLAATSTTAINYLLGAYCVHPLGVEGIGVLAVKVGHPSFQLGFRAEEVV